MSKRSLKFASSVLKAAILAGGKSQTVRVAVQPSAWDGFAAAWPQAGRRAFLRSFVSWQASTPLVDAMAGLFVSELVYPYGEGKVAGAKATMALVDEIGAPQVSEGAPFKLFPWQETVIDNLHKTAESGIKGA